MTDSVKSGVKEACMKCGQETAAGTIFYSDRHELTLPDGGRAYLCSECVQRDRSAGLEARAARTSFTPHGASMMWFGGVKLRRRD